MTNTTRAAQFGAQMASKGLTPDQVGELLTNVQPALDEAVRLAQSGVDVDHIQFEIR